MILYKVRELVGVIGVVVRHGVSNKTGERRWGAILSSPLERLKILIET
jgi:hypothetical protein